MEQYQITSAFIGLVIAIFILWLVRRDFLHGRYAIWWISVGVTCALLGIFPQLIDWFAIRLGIGYPPILAVILGIGFILLKIITMDIERSKNEVKIHRLAQRLAILEGDLKDDNQVRGGDRETSSGDVDTDREE